MKAGVSTSFTPTLVLALVLVGILGSPGSAAAGAPVYYQGNLQVDGGPANGWYDFEFRTYVEADGGEQLSPTQTVPDVYVSGGAFGVLLNLDESPEVGARYLEVGVRPGDSTGEFATLSPRELISADGITDQQTATGETWRLGVTVEGTSAYASVGRRLAGETAEFRSNHGVTDMYFIFPAPAVQKTVQSARYYVVSRSGSYSSAARMTLEVISFGGTLRHTVSSSAVDLRTAATGAWASIALNGDPNNVVAPGEFLAVHFKLNAAPGGDLEVRPIFEVTVD